MPNSTIRNHDHDGRNPYNNNHSHGHGHGQRIRIRRPDYPNAHIHRRSYYGSGALLIAAGILIPVMILALITNFALGAVGYAVASITMGAALGFSAATFGIGALLVYGVLGLAHLYSGAKECYSDNTSVIDMMRSRVVNADGLSVKGVLKSMSAVIWSPFLLIGGLAGKGVEAAVNACSSKSSTQETQKPSSQPEQTPQKNTGDQGSENNSSQGAPYHSTIFSSTPNNSNEQQQQQQWYWL